MNLLSKHVHSFPAMIVAACVCVRMAAVRLWLIARATASGGESLTS